MCVGTRSFSCQVIIIYCPENESVVADHFVPYVADLGRAGENNECSCMSSVLGWMKIQTQSELEKEET